RVSPGILMTGVKNLNVQVNARLREQVRTEDGQLLDQTYANYLVQFDPSRRFPRVGVQGYAGEQIDFSSAVAGVGNGANVTLFATIRPLDQLTFDVSSGHEWLDREGERAYSARVERVKTIYSFSA